MKRFESRPMNEKKIATLWFNLAVYLNDILQLLGYHQPRPPTNIHRGVTYNDCLLGKQRIEEVYVDPICVTVVLHSLGGDLDDSIPSFLPRTASHHLKVIVTDNGKTSRRLHARRPSHTRQMQCDIFYIGKGDVNRDDHPNEKWTQLEQFIHRFVDSVPSANEVLYFLRPIDNAADSDKIDATPTRDLLNVELG